MRSGGFPLHEDTRLFEFLELDAFQAGLNWRIILHKREALRQASSILIRYDSPGSARIIFPS